MKKLKLTAKQRLFVEIYDGNATKSAIKAGYSERTADRIGPELLSKPHVAEAIRVRMRSSMIGIIADREQRQAFWTRTMLDEKAPLRDRLRASELLGKSEGDFLERREEATTTVVAIEHDEMTERLIQDPEAREMLSRLYEKTHGGGLEEHESMGWGAYEG